MDKNGSLDNDIHPRGKIQLEKKEAEIIRNGLREIYLVFGLRLCCNFGRIFIAIL